jgi:hypothetical protein
LDGAQHDEDQYDYGELSEDSEALAQTGGDFSGAEDNCEGFAHADSFAASIGMLEIADATRREIPGRP